MPLSSPTSLQAYQARLIELISFGTAALGLAFTLAAESGLISFEIRHPVLNALFFIIAAATGLLARQRRHLAQWAFMGMLLAESCLIGIIVWQEPDRYLLTFYIGFLILFGFLTLRPGQGLLIAAAGMLIALTTLRHHPDLYQEVRVHLFFASLLSTLVGLLINHQLHRAAEVLRRYQQQLTRQANSDTLTGLLNRRGFFDSACRLIHTRPDGRIIAFALVDLDHFKQINDTFGHQAGDAALTEVAHRLRLHFPKEALIARFGGDELAVLWLTDSADRAAEQLKRLIAGIRREPLHLRNRSIPVTLSVGLVTTDTCPESMDSLIEQADQALYAAKNGGRDRMVHIPCASGTPQPELSRTA